MSYDTNMESPTNKTYTSLNAAFNFFNTELFGGELPHCLITLQRHKGALGYCSKNRFKNTSNSEEHDEIALNPVHLNRPVINVLSTLVHEMVHSWQFNYGKASRNGYHNREWADKMWKVGLIPTTTGEAGGKETGQRVTHMIKEGGLFDQAASNFLLNHTVDLYQDTINENSRKKLKIKYTCPKCHLNMWGKPDALVACVSCKEIMKFKEALISNNKYIL